MSYKQKPGQVWSAKWRATGVAFCVATVACLAIATLLWLSQPAAPPDGSLARHPALRTRSPADESDALFTRPDILQIVLQLDEANAQKLREDARAYVKCRLIENEGEPLQVGIKLKGAAGSFRELDDRPAFTINVNKYRKQQRFYVLEKFHLNNSVQDESYYSEWLCASICRRLRLPAPRITFAHVWLNDRDLGLYVFKEGFDESFLTRHFKETAGSLYDGGFLQDVDIDLEKDLGGEADDLSDLHRLREACLEEDPLKQRSLLEGSLDLDAFLTFMAFETMACHWDGYVANMNNYRLYFPASGGAWFLPHGMDQMFQDTEFSVFEPRGTMVTRAVRRQPDWNEGYRQRVKQLLPLFEPNQLIASLESLEVRLRSELLKLDPDCGPARDDQLAQWRERLTRRYASIVEQLEQPDPPARVDAPSTMETIDIEIGASLELHDWYARQETPESILTISQEEPPVYRIDVGAATDCVASWRCAVQLPPGRYRLAAELRGEAVTARPMDERGLGAGLRISGVNRDQGFSDNFDWQPAVYEFEVRSDKLPEPQEADSQPVDDEPTGSQVELVSELRATAGWCEMRGATLSRLPD